MKSVVLKDNNTVKNVKELLRKELEEGKVTLNSKILIFPMADPSGYLSGLVNGIPVGTPGRNALLTVLRKLNAM